MEVNTKNIGNENQGTLSERAVASLDKPVSELELSARVMTTLTIAGITTVRELVARSEVDMLRC